MGKRKEGDKRGRNKELDVCDGVGEIQGDLDARSVGESHLDLC